MIMRAVGRRVSEVLDGLRSMINKHERYCAVFDSPEGKLVLADLMKRYKILETSHVPGDPYTTAFNEGQRYAILNILRYIKKDTTELIKQIEETTNEQ